MDEYLVPTGYGQDEFVEKKSRFIGRVWLVETVVDDILYGRLKQYITKEV